MQSPIFSVLGILIGAALAGTGIYHWVKEKHDLNSVKVYRTFTLIGAAIVIGVAIKLFFADL